MAKQKLTPQQKLLVKGIVKGLSITDAAKQAGYSEKYAGQVGSQALEAIRLKMPEVLERHGLTDDSLIENYLKPALEAIAGGRGHGSGKARSEAVGPQTQRRRGDEKERV